MKNDARTGAAVEKARSLGGTVTQEYRYALKGYAAKLPDPALAAVRADPRVRFVSPDEEVHATDCYLGNAFTIQTPQVLPCGVDRIDGDVSSTRSGDGKRSVNVNVAVIDSGIDLEHQDLNVVGGKNCQTGNSFDDQNGHGTHVAGTIGAKDNAFGVVGVAPGARLWAVRVLNKNNSGATSKVICGIDFVTATRTDADPTNDIAVANMSLGTVGNNDQDDRNCGMTNNDAMHLAICNSVRAGVAYAVAAGNGSEDLDHSLPAAYDEVLTATAITDLDGRRGGVGTIDALTQAGSPCASSLSQNGPVVDDTPAFFSNFATLASDQAHTVAAPGVCVPSTWNCADTCYARDSGTSMASPHVAGTVALCIFSGPCAGLTPAQIRTKIVADAAAYNQANPGYGFSGDPQHSPDPGKYHGYLIRAGLY